MRRKSRTATGSAPWSAVSLPRTRGSMAHVPDQAIAALREGQRIEDNRLEALHTFTSKVVTDRGWVSEADVNAFLAVGYTKQNVLEVILGVAVKVISNYTNHVAHTPADPVMKNTLWTHPCKLTQAASLAFRAQ